MSENGLRIDVFGHSANLFILSRIWRYGIIETGKTSWDVRHTLFLNLLRLTREFGVCARSIGLKLIPTSGVSRLPRRWKCEMRNRTPTW